MNTDSNGLLRKLAAYALCMLMTTELTQELTEALALQLYAFEQMSIGSGKVMLNRIPKPVIEQIQNNTGCLKQIQSSECIVDTEKLVWCYPSYLPQKNAKSEFEIKSDSSILSTCVDSIYLFDDSFPDPHQYCIGVYHIEMSSFHSRESESSFLQNESLRQSHAARMSVVERSVNESGLKDDPSSDITFFKPSTSTMGAGSMIEPDGQSEKIINSPDLTDQSCSGDVIKLDQIVVEYQQPLWAFFEFICLEKELQIFSLEYLENSAGNASILKISMIEEELILEKPVASQGEGSLYASIVATEIIQLEALMPVHELLKTSLLITDQWCYKSPKSNNKILSCQQEVFQDATGNQISEVKQQPNISEVYSPIQQKLVNGIKMKEADSSLLNIDLNQNQLLRKDNEPIKDISKVTKIQQVASKLAPHKSPRLISKKIDQEEIKQSDGTNTSVGLKLFTAVRTSIALTPKKHGASPKYLIERLKSSERLTFGTYVAKQDEKKVLNCTNSSVNSQRISIRPQTQLSSRIEESKNQQRRLSSQSMQKQQATPQRDINFYKKFLGELAPETQPKTPSNKTVGKLKDDVQDKRDLLQAQPLTSAGFLTPRRSNIKNTKVTIGAASVTPLNAAQTFKKAVVKKPSVKEITESMLAQKKKSVGEISESKKLFPVKSKGVTKVSALAKQQFNLQN